MLQLFYKYIVDELLMGYFETHVIEPGCRYFIIIDNEEYRQGLLQMMRNSHYSQEFEISNIFNSGDTLIKEENYQTFTLTPQHNSIPLIIGDSSNATDDYLTTLRNAVGCSDSEYRNFGIMYILSNNRLESLTTTCDDLQAVGMPLNTDYIKNNIIQKIEHTIGNSYEKKYLKDHLNRLSEKISDGGYSLFDFKEILSVFQKGSLLGSFPTLGYFEDNNIYDMFYQATDKEFQERIEQNAFLYNKISDIFYHADDEDKVTLLSKYLDEKSAVKISKLDDLNQVDFDIIIQGVDKKNSSSKIAIEEIILNKQSSSTELLKRTVGSYEKKSSNFLIVCSPDMNDDVKLKISFNTDIKEFTTSKDVFGRSLTLSLNSDFTYVEVGKDDNLHRFFIKKVSAPASFFADIQHYFKMTKKGSITIDVPDDVDNIKLGVGDKEVFAPSFGDLQWEKDYYLNVPLENGDDSGKFDLSVSFSGNRLDLSFKLNNTHTLPKSALALFELIWTRKITFREVLPETFESHSFSKVIGDDEEFSVYENFRKYLILEKQFIDTGAFSLTRQYNDADFSPKFVDIPASIGSALNDIYAYFRREETVPSLTFIDDELFALYSKYLYAVYYHLSTISENRVMHSNELGVTHLGVVEDQRKVLFSPFHPLLVAYMLEFNENFDCKVVSPNILRLISPAYLLPYFYFDDNRVMRPYISSETEDIKTWMFYENVKKAHQIKTFDITSKMVFEKMVAFISNFNYLFKDINSPIIISTIGISDDSTVLKGVVNFIKDQYVKYGSVQKIELHEYVHNLLDETFFEKLNRLNSDEVIIEELHNIGVEIEKKNLYTAREIIRLLFTRVSFYKHCIDVEDPSINYCHIAFYLMNDSCEYITPPATDMRVEMSMNGLISIPSTVNTGTDYNIGFGANGLKEDGIIYKLISEVNTLYANARNDGRNQFQKNICTAKRFSYRSYELLDKIYTNANWVTFLNPEVDVDFFYKQDLYVVHYSDQFTINAKYDSITVTKHIHQYENMLSLSYERYTNSKMNLEKFNKTMKDYFNSLNGSWLLGMINKSEVQIREKLSIVAASIVMRNFLSRMPDVLWIPVSLEEILRVSGAIGLPKDNSIFSAKELGERGALSDDLLMLGLQKESEQDILYLYPVEVKIAKKDNYKEKGETQIVHTFKVLQEHLVNGSGFESKIYKTFFASQMLSNADKLHANELLSEQEFEIINSSRFDLLNLRYKMSNEFPVSAIGKAALVYFHDNSHKAINTNIVSDVPICHIDLPQKDCFECIAGSNNQLLDFLSANFIHVTEKEDIDLNSINMSDIDKSKEVSTHTITYDFTSVPENVADPIVDLEHTTKVNEQDIVDNVKEALPETSQNKSSIQIIVGKSSSTGENVVFEPNNTKKVSHFNMGIIGTMGTGKTQLARSIIAQFSKEGIHNIDGKPIGMLVFDYKGDYKDQKFLDSVSGHVYRNKLPFNPLKLIVNEDVMDMNLPAITADRISDSLAKAYGLGLKQQNNIKQTIVDAYDEVGITEESSTWNITPPTMKRVIDLYLETYDANDKAYALLSNLRDYNVFTPNNENCISILEWLDSVRVFDLTIYSDETKRVVVSLLLDLFFAEMKQLGESKHENGFREIRSMILVDEAKEFMSKDFKSLRGIISQGRMFGVGMILATQYVDDFHTQKEDYSQSILSWMIHHVNSISKSELTSIFGASDSNVDRYMDFINKAKLFESVCKIGSRVEGIRDLPFFELVDQDERFSSKS